MPNHVRITDELSDGELTMFHSLLSDRRTTHAKAVEWLRDRGHGMSKTRVGVYVQRFRRRPVFSHLVRMGVSTDAGMRLQILQASERLKGEQLAHLAVFSAYLLTIFVSDTEGRTGQRIVAAKQDKNTHAKPGIEGRVSGRRE